jgi:DNA-binding Xre family transcriptional regulator
MNMIRLKVKEVATAKGIGQGKLQRLADMDIKTVRRIYRDPYTIITTETLWKLAKALDVDPRELIDAIPDDSPQTPEKPS